MWRITDEPRAVPAVLGALTAVAHADGEPSPDQRALLGEIARRHGAEPSEPEPWSVQAVAEALPKAEERGRLLRHQVLMALADARLGVPEIELVEAFRRELGSSHRSVDTLRTFARGRTRALTMQLFRRSFVTSIMRKIWQDEGLRGAWRIFKAIARLPNRTQAARHQALGELPPGTLGRVMYEHCRANGFALPGERKGTPEILLFHDIGHALTGHGTDGPGEVQMAGFEAGFMGGDDAYSITLFGMYAFGLGAQVIPTPTKAGDFDVRRFAAAYAEGERLSVDLRFWDPWPSMARPVVEVRRELGLPDVAMASAVPVP